MALDEELVLPPVPQVSHTGHRQRLKDRFLKTRGIGFADYELMELVLFLAIPQRDVKPLAKALVEQFGSFAGAMQASPLMLSQIKGIKDSTVSVFSLIQICCERLLHAPLSEKPLLSSWKELEEYCTMKMAHLKHEEFHVLFLDTRHYLLLDEIHQKGTVNQAPVFPRELVKRCLEVGASGLILVHNHPSGDPTPSKADIEMTKRIQEAARLIDIKVHDHLVVGKKRTASFRALGFL